MRRHSSWRTTTRFSAMRLRQIARAAFCRRPHRRGRHARRSRRRDRGGGRARSRALRPDMPGARGFSGLMYLRAQYPGRAGLRRVGERGCRHDPPLAGAGRRGLRAEIFAAGDYPRRRSRRSSTAATWSPPGLDLADRLERGRRAGGAPAQPDAAAAPRADDDGRGAAQQADRLRAQRLRGDGEGACLRRAAEARRGEPHQGGAGGRPFRARPMAGARAPADHSAAGRRDRAIAPSAPAAPPASPAC